MDTVKTLAQIKPAATILTTAYTVPSNTTATISSIVICNTSASVSYFRVSVCIAGAADDLKQYLYYDLPLDTNDTFIATIGLTLAATDVIKVRSSDGNLAFTCFGIELT
jgi:hypothetical protein